MIAYVDGFNVFHGLQSVCRSQGIGKALYWLDLPSTIRAVLRGREQLVHTNYYTASRIIPERIHWPPQQIEDQQRSNERQGIYLSALRTLPSITISVQRFMERDPHVCAECGNSWARFEEKQTDVKIAVDLFQDAISGKFDVAAIVSADTDLEPAIRAVRGVKARDGEPVRVIPIKPLGRPKSRAILEASGASAWREITTKIATEHQLPPTIERPHASPIRRPSEWSRE